MMRRLLALLAILTGLATLETPAEAGWKNAQQASAIVVSESSALCSADHPAMGTCVDVRNLTDEVTTGRFARIVDPEMPRSVMIGADRALE